MKNVHPGVDSRPIAKTIEVDKLTVYPEVQRIPPTKKLVKEIADNLDISALGTFHVSQRSDGTFSLLDGQRRKLALQMRGMGNYRVNALIYVGLTVAQEARMFRRLNTSRQVGAFDDFDKGVTEGDERDIGILKVMAKISWEVSRANKPGKCACVKSLRRVWDHDGNGSLLARTVTVLDGAFGRDKNTMSGSLVEGLAKCLAGSFIEQEAMIEKLRARHASPISLISVARARAQIERGSLRDNIAYIIEKIFASRKTQAR
jgi:hypothetical protein